MPQTEPPPTDARHAPRSPVRPATPGKPGRPVSGNDVRLLRGGAEYFPALIAAIDEAVRTVALETYIYEDDDVGQAVAQALLRAAARGVDVRLVVDGFGAADMAVPLASSLVAGGVDLKVFRPMRGLRVHRSNLRRMHRKLAVIDARIGFVGGINLIDDLNHGPLDPIGLGPRYDFAVRVAGPLVAEIQLASDRLWWRLALRGEMRSGNLATAAAEFPLPTDLPAPAAVAVGGVRASLLLRDNLRNRRTIERAYLHALGSARHGVILANAYFLPGHKMRRALLACRKRGVRVRLLLQGMIEYKLQHYATHALYATLLEAGVEIYEYSESFLHAKVAVVDDHWATVGSSNMDPFSLLLAREANVAVFDAGFASGLRRELEGAIENRSVEVLRETHASRSRLHRFADWSAYLLLRFAVVIAGVTGRY